MIHIKHYGIGGGVGARCFALLLFRRNAHDSRFDHPRIGSWLGDHVFVDGDDHFPDFDSVVVDQWTDIATEVLEMVAETDPHVFLSHGGESWLIDYARSRDMPESIRRTLLQAFRRERSLDSEASDRYLHVIDALRPSD